MGYVDSVPKCLRADAKFSHGTENYYHSRFTTFNGDPHRSNLATDTVHKHAYRHCGTAEAGWVGAPIPMLCHPAQATARCV